jgi:hypothetical protein
MADGLRAVVVGFLGGKVRAVYLWGVLGGWARRRCRRETRYVCEGSTCSMASLTRWDLIRPLRSRLSMRALLVAPELRQAMVAAEMYGSVL